MIFEATMLPGNGYVVQSRDVANLIIRSPDASSLLNKAKEAAADYMKTKEISAIDVEINFQ